MISCRTLTSACVSQRAVFRFRRTWCAFVAVFVCACGRPVEKIEISLKGERFVVEVARTDEERRQGLKYRDRLGEREGMIFVFESDQRLSFWMEDTRVPLSIAFLSKSGEILQIADMEPFSRAITRSKFSCRYALELPQGSFQAVRVKEGDRAILPDGFR